jgi:diaminohydroxyphosphoribosylaminopyrimidine deaminase/5-amino-6-(5-phosphoribosylamino)uracil reductase
MPEPRDRQLMRRALRLAERGWGRVHPNPMVGAVVVRDGVVVAEAWHAEYGQAHAEAAALRNAGESARGATLYVTLEPCRHHGKTPPCTDAIVASGVRRVVFGAADPNPRAGGGAALLAARGIEVVGGVERAAVRAVDAPFFHVHERGTPWVTLKLALSLDARLSRARGERTRITGPSAERAVHQLRAGFDAILVGIGTVLADDPLLTVRGPLQPRVAPIRVVLDSAARLPPDGRLALSAAETPVWLLCAGEADPVRIDALEARGVRVLQVPRSPAGLDVACTLDALWREGVRRVLVEGGGRVAASLLSADRVERLHLFQAPVLLGPGGVEAFPLDRPPPPAGWRLRRTKRWGNDVMVIWDRWRDDAAS